VAERSRHERNPSRLRASMGNGSRGVTDCQLLFLFTDALFESRGLIRTRLEEVERLEGVSGGLIDLIRLWKCVEKSKDPGSKRRTWGTLRVVLICVGVRVPTFGRRELGRSRLNRSGTPAPKEEDRIKKTRVDPTWRTRRKSHT